MVPLQYRPIRPFPQVELVSLNLIRLAEEHHRDGFINFFFIFLGNDSGETATCLFNSPHEDAVLPRVLPGKLLSLDAQCRMDRGTSACFVIIVTRYYIVQFKNFLNFFFLISYETTERRPRLRSALLFRRFVGVLCLLQTGCRGLCLRRRTGNLLISNAYCA